MTGPLAAVLTVVPCACGCGKPAVRMGGVPAKPDKDGKSWAMNHWPRRSRTEEQRATARARASTTRAETKLHKRVRAERAKEDTLAARHRYVYLVSAPNGLTKIGRSEDAHKRIAALQNSSPVPLVLAAVMETTYRGATRLEKLLHDAFEDRRDHNEWFEVSPEEVLAKARNEGWVDAED